MCNKFEEVIQSSMKDMLYACSWLEPFLQNDLTKIVEVMNSRAVFIPELSKMVLTQSLVAVRYNKKVFDAETDELRNEIIWGSSPLILN